MKKLLLIAMLAVGLSGCAAVPSHLGMALVQIDKEGVTVADASARKMGRACGSNILGVVALGDLSIEKAKRSAGIQKVATVDKEVKSFFGVYSHVCTIVTGE